VVVGNGMAGCRAVEEILARDANRFAITIFGAEPRVNYNRIMLSPVLAGEKEFDDIVINTAEWYEEMASRWCLATLSLRSTAKPRPSPASRAALRLMTAC
jgi:NAD(P)H-nitrite reductase large subunit